MPDLWSDSWPGISANPRPAGDAGRNMYGQPDRRNKRRHPEAGRPGAAAGASGIPPEETGRHIPVPPCRRGSRRPRRAGPSPLPIVASPSPTGIYYMVPLRTIEELHHQRRTVVLPAAGGGGLRIDAGARPMRCGGIHPSSGCALSAGRQGTPSASCVRPIRPEAESAERRCLRQRSVSDHLQIEKVK